MMVSNRAQHANELVRPSTLAEARAELAADPSMRLIGGGTAVVPSLRDGAVPGRWLTTTSIAGLDGISVDAAGTLTIGAAASLRRIELDQRVRADWPLLRTALAAIAGPAIRNAATIGGSLALGSGSPDPALALSALGASVSISGGGTVAVEELEIARGSLRGPFIEAVRVPPMNGAGWGHQRFTVRGASDRPFVIVAVVVAPGSTRVVTDVGKDRPIPLTTTAEALSRRQPWDRALKRDIKALLMPDSDRGSGRYRSRVALRMAERAIATATSMAGDA